MRSVRYSLSKSTLLKTVSVTLLLSCAGAFSAAPTFADPGKFDVAQNLKDFTEADANYRTMLLELLITDHQKNQDVEISRGLVDFGVKAREVMKKEGTEQPQVKAQLDLLIEGAYAQIVAYENLTLPNAATEMANAYQNVTTEQIRWMVILHRVEQIAPPPESNAAPLSDLKSLRSLVQFFRKALQFENDRARTDAKFPRVVKDTQYEEMADMRFVEVALASPNLDPSIANAPRTLEAFQRMEMGESYLFLKYLTDRYLGTGDHKTMGDVLKFVKLPGVAEKLTSARQGEVKILAVKQLEQLTLQYHHELVRSETLSTQELLTYFRALEGEEPRRAAIHHWGAPLLDTQTDLSKYSTEKLRKLHTFFDQARRYIMQRREDNSIFRAATEYMAKIDDILKTRGQ